MTIIERFCFWEYFWESFCKCRNANHLSFFAFVDLLVSLMSLYSSSSSSSSSPLSSLSPKCTALRADSDVSASPRCVNSTAYDWTKFGQTLCCSLPPINFSNYFQLKKLVFQRASCRTKPNFN